MKRAYTDAQKKIESALRSQATELDISGEGGIVYVLTALPASLSSLTQLEVLVLSRNKLTELPSWFSRLTKLRALDLSDNALKILPEWLGDLSELESLNLAFNRLRLLPQSFTQLSKLKTVDLSYNQLEYLPPEMGNMTELTGLSLANNSLEELPESLSSLRQLQMLDASQTGLKAMPESLRQLEWLKNLEWNNNELTQLPDWLDSLAKLEKLSDTDLIPGEDWDQIIQERLSEAQIILFMVSRDFLASRYITEHERPVAMSLMNEKKAVVVPVLLSTCSWQDEDFAKLEKLPRKDELISSITPREDAWALVEEGLKKVVERVRSSSTVLPQNLSRLAKH